jgi:hypothetical protein
MFIDQARSSNPAEPALGDASQTCMPTPQLPDSQTYAPFSDPPFHSAGSAPSTYIFFLQRALFAVIGVADAWSTADDASPLKAAVAAFFAYTHERGGPHIAVADWALAVALFAQPANADARLLPAHDQVRVMLRSASTGGYTQLLRPIMCVSQLPRWQLMHSSRKHRPSNASRLVAQTPKDTKLASTTSPVPCR